MLQLMKRSGSGSGSNGGPGDRSTGTALPALGPSDEIDLVRRCRARERAAHDEFYQRYKRPIAANLYRVLGDRNELEDLVQEVFVIAFRGLDGFRGEARLSTWLYRICVNVALGRIRSRVRKPAPIGVDDLDEVARGSSDGDRPETPARALERRQDRERVYRTLEAMAPKKRLVLYLHEIEGMDLKDIAYIVESNAVTVRTRLFYAKREFYRLLTADLNGDVLPAGSDDEAGES